jgi:HK97 gp10 family phage protein
VKTVYRSRLKSIAAASPKATRRALLATGEDILSIAKQLVPVDTSALQKSGAVLAISDYKVEVGFGGPGVYYANREPEKYAMHVEYGTVNSPAQPYLRPAFMQSDETFKARLNEEIKKLI